MILDQHQIKALIPHREPMLLLEQVLELEAGKYCKAEKNTSENDYFFKGHFPGNPIMPGIILIEAMTQTSAVVAASNLMEPQQYNYYFGGTNKNWFRQPVVPGDRLILESKLINHRLSLWTFSGVVRVKNVEIASAEIKLMVFDPQNGTISPD